MLKTISWVLVAIALIAFVMLLLLYFAQEKLIFYPEKLSKDHKYAFSDKFEEYFIKVDDETELNALLFKAGTPSKGLVFYLHGNAGCLNSWGDVAGLYLKQNYDVFIVDYRGYGKSGGKISSEAQITNDIQKVYDFVREIYDEHKIIIIGYSIGTGPASKLAADNNAKMLILKAPYYSLIDLTHHYYPFAPSFMLKYKFQTNKNLEKVTAPVYIFHGDKDEVIYHGSSVKLSKLLKEKDEFVTLKNQVHNGVNDNEEYGEYISGLLK